MSRRHHTLRTAFAVLIAALALRAGPADAQVLSGRVVQMGWAEPVSGALVYLLDEALAQVDSALTDGAGRFVFARVRAGTYQLQASAAGEFSTLSDPLTMAGADRADLVLIMPSRLFTMASECLPRAVATGTGVLAGIAFDATSRSPIPTAEILVEWTADGGGSVQTLVDGGGRFTLCGVPAGRPLQVRAVAFGREGDAQEVTIEPGSMHRADLAIAATSGPLTGARLEVVERRPTGTDRSRVSGRVLDAETGQPVVAAVVAIAGAEDEVLTDGAGRFRIEGVRPAQQLMEIERLGYGQQAASVAVGEGSEVIVEVTLPARPVDLPGVAVDARRPLMGLTAVNSSRIVAGAEMAAYERRGARFESILRERFPIRISHGVFRVGQINRRFTCLESRRVTRFEDRSTGTDTILDYPECEMIPMFVDDVPVADPGTFVDLVHVEDYETIVYLGPTEVGMRYGLEGNSVGVILLYSRGRGPFVDRARNVREPAAPDLQRPNPAAM